MSEQVLIDRAGGLEELYRARFAPSDIEAKDRVWTVLCRNFFSRYVKPTDHVLDIAAGYCEFINHIECAEKYAFDMNPDIARFAGHEVHLLVGDCRDMSVLGSKRFDVAFISNFFEHLETRRDIDLVLQQAYGHLRPGGRLIILQPNIRYVGARYWDFYDHSIALTHVSMTEALRKNRFQLELMVPKFLPYTFKSRLPNFEWAVRLYLRLPIVWHLFGKQMLAVAIRPEH